MFYDIYLGHFSHNFHKTASQMLKCLSLANLRCCSPSAGQSGGDPMSDGLWWKGSGFPTWDLWRHTATLAPRCKYTYFSYVNVCARVMRVCVSQKEICSHTNMEPAVQPAVDVQHEKIGTGNHKTAWKCDLRMFVCSVCMTSFGCTSLSWQWCQCKFYQTLYQDACINLILHIVYWRAKLMS